jgi:hypothetical protein
MKHQDYHNFTAHRRLARVGIHQKKAQDYADEDSLSNFKRVAEVCRIFRVNCHTASGIALIYLILKLDRETNLRHKMVTAQNESREDTRLDMMNYMELYDALCEEEK